jgi:hypothetical protein
MAHRQCRVEVSGETRRRLIRDWDLHRDYGRDALLDKPLR